MNWVEDMYEGLKRLCRVAYPDDIEKEVATSAWRMSVYATAKRQISFIPVLVVNIDVR